MTFTWILTPLPSEGSPQVTGSERGLTIASDSLAGNADTLQGHRPGLGFQLQCHLPRVTAVPATGLPPTPWPGPLPSLLETSEPTNNPGQPKIDSMRAGAHRRQASCLWFQSKTRNKETFQGPLKGTWGASTAYDLTLISPTRGFP